MPAKPVDKFCGQCGSPLGPDSGTGTVEQTSNAPAKVKTVLFIALAIITVILVILAVVVLMSGARNAPSSSATTNQSIPSGSYVLIETETPVTTALITLPPTTTVPPTEIPTTVKTPKYGTCPADRKFCGTNCTDPMTDSSNCGYCNNKCPQGQACVNGNCMLDCPAGKTACVEGCFNLNTDPDHCGICSNNCPAGLICSNGQCSPPPTSYITAI